MTNNVEYNEIMAFHPGYYIQETIEDLEITQEEFAIRLGTTAKTISKLVNGEINLSNDIAHKLSNMLGTSVELWLNLQTTYENFSFASPLDTNVCILLVSVLFLPSKILAVEVLMI